MFPELPCSVGLRPSLTENGSKTTARSTKTVRNTNGRLPAVWRFPHSTRPAPLFQPATVADRRYKDSSNGTDFRLEISVFGVEGFLEIELNLESDEEIAGDAEAKLDA